MYESNKTIHCGLLLACCTILTFEIRGRKIYKFLNIMKRYRSLGHPPGCKVRSKCKEPWCQQSSVCGYKKIVQLDKVHCEHIFFFVLNIHVCRNFLNYILILIIKLSSFINVSKIRKFRINNNWIVIKRKKYILGP